MKVKFNQSIQAMWGGLGNLVFRRTHNGKVVVSAAPDMSRVKWSDAQQAHRLRFKLWRWHMQRRRWQTPRSAPDTKGKPPPKANVPSIWRSRIISTGGI